MKYRFTFFLVLFPFLVFSQACLNRPDSVKKETFWRYEMSNFSTPQEGQNRIWDFRDALLDAMPRRVHVVTERSADTIFVVLSDGQTAYYHFLHREQYVQIKYEQNHIRMAYDSTPQILLQYPMCFRQHFQADYKGTGYYTLDRFEAVKGHRRASMTAYGSLILPDGQIVNDVFLVRSQTRQAALDDSVQELFQDGYTFYRSESVIPVVEIFYDKRQSSDGKSETLATRAYCYVLEQDEPGMAYSQASSESMLSTEEQLDALTTGIAPNPTTNETVVTLDLNAPDKVFLDIHTLQGHQVYSTQWDFPSGGTYRKRLYLNNFQLPQGTYLVTIRSSANVQTHKVQKL